MVSSSQSSARNLVTIFEICPGEQCCPMSATGMPKVAYTSSPLERDVDRKGDSGMSRVVHVVPVMRILHVNIIGVIPAR